MSLCLLTTLDLLKYLTCQKKDAVGGVPRKGALKCPFCLWHQLSINDLKGIANANNAVDLAVVIDGPVHRSVERNLVRDAVVNTARQ